MREQDEKRNSECHPTTEQRQNKFPDGDNPLTAISVAKECKMISEGFDVYLLEKENPKKKVVFFFFKLFQFNSI